VTRSKGGSPRLPRRATTSYVTHTVPTYVPRTNYSTT